MSAYDYFKVQSPETMVCCTEVVHKAVYNKNGMKRVLIGGRSLFLSVFRSFFLSLSVSFIPPSFRSFFHSFLLSVLISSFIIFF
jgi:hypothetical protein